MRSESNCCCEAITAFGSMKCFGIANRVLALITAVVYVIVIVLLLPHTDDETHGDWVRLVLILLGVALIGALMVIIAGIMYLTAAGTLQEKVQAARQQTQAVMMQTAIANSQGVAQPVQAYPVKQ